MPKSHSSLRVLIAILVGLNLILSCQPGPLPSQVKSGNASNNASSGVNESLFRIQDWAGTSYGTTNEGLRSLSVQLTYSGVERRPSSDSITLLSEPGGRDHEYALLLGPYVLDAQGKQYPVGGRLVFNGGDVTSNEVTKTYKASNFHFVADLESTDGITFHVTGGHGFGGSSYNRPDGEDHGNAGICTYYENVDYAFEDMAGSVSIDLASRTFTASVRSQNAEGLSKHSLAPWQCSYPCAGGYSDECANALNVTASVSLSGSVNYVAPEKLEVYGTPDIFSPANQDGRFDNAVLYARASASEQLYRYTWPNFNGAPLVSDNTWGGYWHGKIDDNTFYPDGRYPVEVVTDHAQKITTYVRIDNTEPIVSTPTIVNRNGSKAVEVIIEDPEVNGVRAGLNRNGIEAYVNSNRPGRWSVSQVNLDSHRVLVSAVFSPDPVQASSGDYEENLIIRATDKVFNVRPFEDLPFNFNQPAQSPSPTPIPTPSSSDCEDAPLLLPEDIEDLMTDVNNVHPVEPQTLNKHRNYTAQMNVTADQLRELGYNVPAPQPVILPSSPPAFSTQNFIEPAFRIASAYPSSYPSGGPSLSPRAQRLFDKYQSIAREQDSYRNGVLSNLQQMDWSYHQLLLTSTEFVGSTYIEDAYPLDMSFEDYKAAINDLHDEFISVLENNTYSLVEATQVYANVALVYDNLLKLMLLGHLPIDNMPTDISQTQYFSDRLEEITQPWQLVNFTANRLKSYQQQILNRHYTLKSEVDILLREAEEQAVEINYLEKDIEVLLSKASELGIEVGLSNLPAAPEPPSSNQGFSTQMAQLVIAPAVVGAVLIAAPHAPRAFQIALNAWRAFKALQTVKNLMDATDTASKANKPQIPQLQRQLANPTMPANIRAQKEAQLAQAQTRQADIDGLMAMAKEKRQKATSTKKKADKTKNSANASCQAPCNWNWKSRKTWGHTFLHHGKGKKNRKKFKRYSSYKTGTSRSVATKRRNR